MMQAETPNGIPVEGSSTAHSDEQTPPDCFRIGDLQALQSFENHLLADVNYYLWLNRAGDSNEVVFRFLYFLELVFEDAGSLLLTSGEDSTAIRVSDAETLLHTASGLQNLHGQVSIQRLNAGAFPLWQPAIGKNLAAINLPRHENGLYANDALQLDFGSHQLVIQLSRNEGLEIIEH